MGCCGIGFGRWNDRAEPMRQPQDWWRQPPPSGNRAFDEYRADALRRLEEEQREFQEFLDRLRMAKDKAEFDQFMAECRSQGRPRRSRRKPEIPVGGGVDNSIRQDLEMPPCIRSSQHF